MDSYQTFVAELSAVVLDMVSPDTSALVQLGIDNIQKDRSESDNNFICNKLGITEIIPDKMLVEAIDKDLPCIYICIALRLGANPNLYVNSYVYQEKIHIIGYLHKNIKNLHKSRFLFYVLLGSGSKLTSPIFENCNLTVEDWIFTQDLHFSDIFQVYLLNKNTISIMLDRPDLLSFDKSSNRFMEEIIENRADKVLNDMVSFQRFSISDLSTLISLAIKHMNQSAYRTLIEHHVSPSYNNINEILLAMRRYHRMNETFSYSQFEIILRISLDAGIQLDREQSLILDSLNFQEKREVETDQILDRPNDDLKLMACSLHINTSSKSEISKYLSTCDVKLIKEAVVRLQVARSSGMKISDFVSRPDLYQRFSIASPKEDIVGDIDIDIIYYKEKDIIWCFTNDEFDHLRETKINHYTNEILPDEFVSAVSDQRNMAKRLGFPTNRATEDISSQKEPEWPDLFNQIASIYGFEPTTLENLDQRMLTAVLISLGLDIDLRDLSLQHAHVTFYRTSYEVIRKDPDIAETLFDNLRIVSQGCR